MAFLRDAHARWPYLFPFYASQIFKTILATCNGIACEQALLGVGAFVWCLAQPKKKHEHLSAYAPN